MKVVFVQVFTSDKKQEQKIIKLEKEIENLNNVSEIDELFNNKKEKKKKIRHLKQQKRNLKKEKYFEIIERSSDEEKEKQANKLASRIYWEVVVSFILFTLLVVRPIYFYIDTPYKATFIGLLTVLITFCFEPYFNMRTDNFSKEYFDKYLKFKLNTMKITCYVVLFIIFSALFIILTIFKSL